MRKKEHEMNKVFGIDLGTTYSCIAYVDEFGKSVVLKNSEGNNTTPSVVYYESIDNIIVGDEAKNMLPVEPDSTIAFVKRRIGTDDEDGKPFRYEIHGQEISPEEISSKILKKLVADANEELRNNGILEEGEEVKDVVITCPAYFGMREKIATENAGKLAGLNVLDIINEPTAAAINYGIISKEENKNVMVYDLGGGTFDITIIQTKDGEINVAFSDGDRNLGGKDWDQEVADYLASEFEEKTGLDYYVDDEAANDILLIAERAKKSLSSKQTVKVTLNAGGKRQTIDLTRDKFDEITSIRLQSTLYKTDDCLEGAAKTNENKKFAIALDDIDEILLVGGSTKMPQISQALEAKYHKPIALFDPDEAVAKGAAMHALYRQNYKIIISEIAKQSGKTEEAVDLEAKKENKALDAMMKEANISNTLLAAQLSAGPALSRVRINNALSRTYGVDYYNESRRVPEIENLLLKGDTLPARATASFLTLQDGKEVLFGVFESESPDRIMEIDDGHGLGSTLLVFPRELPRGTKVDVELNMDNSGLLTLVATEPTTKSVVTAQYNPSGGLSADEVVRIRSRTQSENVN